MPTLVFGILVLVLVLWALNAYCKADPKMLAQALPSAGGIGALALAGVSRLPRPSRDGHSARTVRARPAGLGAVRAAGLFQRTQKTPGQMSRVRSAFVEMELDHDSGAMHGRILAGPHEGAALEALDLATLLGLLPEIDDESRALLAAYLDRREPSWREHAQGGATAGNGAARSGGKMTEEEAYQILGVKMGASAEEIGRAHRSLMKKLHPDQGGSTYLAAQINEAKEVLLRRHR